MRREKPDEEWMEDALKEAEKAEKMREVPVGAIVVFENKIIGKGHNLTESKKDATMHAEMVSIRNASKKLKRWRLSGCGLYVTLEPCAMCAGAILLSRIKRVVFGAWDKKNGACGSKFDFLREYSLNEKIEVRGGVKEKECSLLLKRFFQEKRQLLHRLKSRLHR